MSPDPITPISDEAIANLRAMTDGDPTQGFWRRTVDGLLARLDAAEAGWEKVLTLAEGFEADLRESEEHVTRLVHQRENLKGDLDLAEAALTKWQAIAREREDAALASPEGVVTLPKLGQRVRITTGGGMDHVGEVTRYGDPEGNVRTLFMVALDDGSSGYFLDEPSWHWTLVPYRPEDTP